jgi:ATP-dependent helicase/nuclease subunit A
MTKSAPRAAPPDHAARERALDTSRSILVRAPAGSGKTDLLTRRFLRLLGEVDDPSEIVAITFTKAAAAEMRNRILSELERALRGSAETRGEQAEAESGQTFTVSALARRALAQSENRGWDLLNLPAQLRITTIDAFCRELALQQPLLSGLGGGLEISEQPKQLYRRAARRTLESLERNDERLSQAVERLLLWRDNGWHDVEDQLVQMLEQRDRWMEQFVLDRAPNWDELRERLELPFSRETRNRLARLERFLDRVPGAREQAHELARFACAQTGRFLHRELAELADFPSGPLHTVEELETARQAYGCLANLLLTEGSFRRRVDTRHGFPSGSKAEQQRLFHLIADLQQIPGLQSALGAAGDLPPARYTEEEWLIVRAAFVLLRHAAAELQVVFAEAAAVDYVEVAQIALRLLRGADGQSTDAALAVADRIRHLLVDEFQDTSRRQHQLLAHLIAAWPDPEGRTCFVVGDPMQSIYFFRDADAELFPRVERLGLEIPGELPVEFDIAHLTANFRSAPGLVDSTNELFARVFSTDDGGGIAFTAANAERDEPETQGTHLVQSSKARMQLHLEFMPQIARGGPMERTEAISALRAAARDAQIQKIVALVQNQQLRIEQARAANEAGKSGRKFRVAVLGRTRKVLAPIAAALREAGISFRAIDLEALDDRSEITDALALARALLNPEDRVAWLGVLRAPWCGLTLADLHNLVSADARDILARPVPVLLADRIHLLSDEGRAAVQRVLDGIQFADRLRTAEPAASAGTWLEQVWLQLGGAQCVDAAARANLNLLFSKIDALPEGEQDLLGPALESAFKDLKAQPDPAAESDFGVQLMTIHKSKGLEFEVVIVPELEAPEGATRGKMLSWLERGLAEPDESAEITEFLVAPIQAKGSDRGSARRFVDRAYRERESQELRRLLYVAATRAREELHFFARPEYKTGNNGELSLCDANRSLLGTAWPGLAQEIARQFDSWNASRHADSVQPATIAAIAASASGAAISASAAATMRRLPIDFTLDNAESPVSKTEAPLLGAGRLYARHEGGFLSRALGQAVHALLQKMSELLIADPGLAEENLGDFVPLIASQIRGMGADPPTAKHIAHQALKIAGKAAVDSIGRWILGPHVEAASEVRWTAVISGNLRSVQADRVFRAGSTPRSEASGDDPATWWIVDYKTTEEAGLNSDFTLAELRPRFAPQLEAYAEVLRKLHGTEIAIHAGLYYPRMLLFDWWAV